MEKDTQLEAIDIGEIDVMQPGVYRTKAGDVNICFVMGWIPLSSDPIKKFDNADLVVDDNSLLLRRHVSGLSQFLWIGDTGLINTKYNYAGAELTVIGGYQPLGLTRCMRIADKLGIVREHRELHGTAELIAMSRRNAFLSYHLGLKRYASDPW